MNATFQPLAHYLQQAHLLSASDFLENYNHPVLLWSRSLGLTEAASFHAETCIEDITRDQPSGFTPTSESQIAETLVIEIRKHHSASPAHMICVGRAADNDIMIAQKTVSKLHAYFLRREGACEIVDAGSSNGTMLNKQRLIPHQKLSLVNYDRIQLGPSVELMYLHARGFFDFLQQLLRAGIS